MMCSMIGFVWCIFVNVMFDTMGIILFNYNCGLLMDVLLIHSNVSCFNGFIFVF